MDLENELKTAVADHGLWKKMLKEAIDTGVMDVQISTVLSDKECSFGKWLYSSAIKEDEKNFGHYKRVLELHAVFHEIAAQVVQYSVSDQKDRAMAMLDVNGAFTASSAALTTAMLDWLNELISDKDEKSALEKRSN